MGRNRYMFPLHKPRCIDREGKLRQRTVEWHRRQCYTDGDHLDMYTYTDSETRYTPARSLLDLLPAFIIVGEIYKDHFFDIQLSTYYQVAEELIGSGGRFAGLSSISE